MPKVKRGKAAPTPQEKVDELLDGRRNKFEFQAKSVAITCSRWRATRMGDDEWLQWVTANYVAGQPWVAEEWCFAQEDHKDGSIHYHGYIQFAARFKTRDCNAFDRKAPETINEHCHIKTAKNGKGWQRYVQKAGRFIGNVEKVKEADPSLNYRKRRDDLAAYEEDKRRAEKAEIKWPLVLPWCTVEKPDPAVKKRHWWITGPPDIGKTYQVQEVIDGMKVFMASGDGQYRYEHYAGQELIVYDDCIPKLVELLSVTNTWKSEVERPGGSRYKKAFWPEKHTRTVVVLTNLQPPTDSNGAFSARFNVVDLHPKGADPLNVVF